MTEADLGVLAQCAGFMIRVAREWPPSFSTDEFAALDQLRKSCNMRPGTKLDLSKIYKKSTINIPEDILVTSSESSPQPQQPEIPPAFLHFQQQKLARERVEAEKVQIIARLKREAEEKRIQHENELKFQAHLKDAADNLRRQAELAKHDEIRRSEAALHEADIERLDFIDDI